MATTRETILVDVEIENQPVKDLAASFGTLTTAADKAAAAMRKMDAATTRLIKDIRTLGAGFNKQASATQNLASAYGRADKELGSFRRSQLMGVLSTKTLNKGLVKTTSRLDEASMAFRAMGPAGTFAGDSLERLSLVMSGPLGASIAAVVGGLAAVGLALKAGAFLIGKYIDSTGELTEASNQAALASDRLAASLGKMLVGDDFDKALDGLTIKLDELTFLLDLAQESSHPVARGIRAIGGALIYTNPLTAAWSAVLDVSVLVADRSTQSSNTLAAAFRNIGSAARSAAGEVGGLLRQLASVAKAKIGKEFGGAWAAITGAWAGTKKKKRRGGGGGAKRDTGPQIIAARQSVPMGGMAGALGQGPTIEDWAGGVAIEQGMATQRKADMTASLEGIRAGLPGVIALGKGFKDMLDPIAKSAELMKDLDESLAGALTDSMLGMAEALGSVTGELLAGGDAMAGFGKKMLSMLGALASQMGGFYVATGIAMNTVIPGSGVASIAAGVALKVLGGVLGGLSKGGSGAGSRSRAGAGGASARQFAPTGPRRDEPQVTNLKVVILGEEIDKPLTRFMDNQMRLNRFNNFMPRGV
tara:strand:+ start:16950 stop:18716 length:1767 start_codon:yes stop_codon:yes gene_type:complete